MRLPKLQRRTGVRRVPYTEARFSSYRSQAGPITDIGFVPHVLALGSSKSDQARRCVQRTSIAIWDSLIALRNYRVYFYSTSVDRRSRFGELNLSTHVFSNMTRPFCSLISLIHLISVAAIRLNPISEDLENFVICS